MYLTYSQTDKPIDKPIDKLIDKPIDKPIEKPIDKPIDMTEGLCSNVRLYYAYPQYKNLFIYRFVSEDCLRSTQRLFYDIDKHPTALAECIWLKATLDNMDYVVEKKRNILNWTNNDITMYDYATIKAKANFNALLAKCQMSYGYMITCSVSPVYHLMQSLSLQLPQKNVFSCQTEFAQCIYSLLKLQA